MTDYPPAYLVGSRPIWWGDETGDILLFRSPGGPEKGEHELLSAEKVECPLLKFGPPLLAWCFLNAEWFAFACGWSVIVGFFALWHWMVGRTAALGEEARGNQTTTPLGTTRQASSSGPS